ncbi:MAG: helix-turn-helix domain-containing protein [Lachnospirales bacterium]
MDIDYCAIGKRIRKRRKELNITQAKLAEMANLSDTNISHIERGATKLGLPTIIAIANALDTNVDSFLMDVVNNSKVEFKKEFEKLLMDCSPDEYSLLYDTCNVVLKAYKKHCNKQNNM